MTRFKRTFVSVACLAFLTAGPVSPSYAQQPGPDILKVQVLLDRLGFSPGVIDGKAGKSLTLALKGFQEAKGVPVTGLPDEATIKALEPYAGLAPVIEVTLGDRDFAGPFVGKMPARPADQAKLPSMGYADAAEALAERYHTSAAALAELNGPTGRIAPGAKVKVPNVVPAVADYPEKLRPDWKATLASLSISSQQPQAARIEVLKSQGVLRVLDADGKVVAQFPATMGSQHDPLPIGHWKIQGTSYLPTYHFNPKLFWDAKPGEGKETLKAGPNSPVGVVWMDLNKAHYGIHGTPEPSRIGRSESHGCIRLTNWDAARLSLMVKPGTPAEFKP